MREKLVNFLRKLVDDLTLLGKLIKKKGRQLISWKSLAIFLSLPIVFSCFFWIGLKPPFAQGQDIAVIYLLVIVFAAVLLLSVTFKELRKFLFYQFFPYIIVASEMINFKLYTQFDVENAVRYGLALSFMGLLADFGATMVLNSLNLKKVSAAISAIWQVVLASLFVGVLARNIFGQSRVELETVTAIYQTDLTEAVSYVQQHESILFAIIFLIILIAAGVFGYIKLPTIKIVKNLFYRVVIIIICALIAYSAIGSIHKYYRKSKLWLFSILRKGGAFRHELVKFNQEAERRKLIALTPDEAQKVLDKGNNGRFILVLGESNSRDYMGCYTYKEDTTPFLSKMRKDERFTFFENVFSNHVHTTEALKYLLTEQNQYNGRENLGVTLFDVLRYCKYKSFFISNQYVYDCFRSPVSAISQAADEINYINTEMDFIIRKNRLDIEAINALKELKLDERAVVVIHLMSCHAPYQVRYPDGFRNDLSKRYERAIAYMDYVLSQLFEYAMQNDFIDGVLFIPDHGEDAVLGDHDSAIFTPDMTRIPMVCYLSDSYIKKNSELHERLKRAENKVFTNDLVFDFMLDLMGIKNSFNSSELQLLSDDYILNMDNGRTLHGRAKLNSTEIMPKQE